LTPLPLRHYADIIITLMLILIITIIDTLLMPLRHYDAITPLIIYAIDIDIRH
jgi:hypothetical protein